MITETSFNKHILTSSLTFNHLKCIRNLQLWFASGLKVMLIDAHPLKRGSIAVLQLFSSLFQLFFNFFVGYLRLQRVICRLNSPHPATINYTSYFNNDIYTHWEFFISVYSFKIRQKIVCYVQLLNLWSASGMKWK